MSDIEKNENQKPPRIEMVEIGDDGCYGKFICEPLGRGYGITIGNSLRRMLLSSLEGAAVTSIRIDGVLHEFSTLPGVREDITNIVLNIKQLCLRIEDDQNQQQQPFAQVSSLPPTTYTLRIDVDVEQEIKDGNKYGKFKDGRREVTADDIECDPIIEVMNPDLHIAWLNETGKLRMEMTARTGRGYDQAEKNKNPDDIIGTIPIDSIFSPVVRVNFNVEDTRVGNEMDFDKLTLEVWTNGTLRPEEAVAKAAAIMIAHMKLFLNMDGVGPEPAPEPEKEKVEIEPVDEANFTLDKTTIEDLDLSVRSFNCLKRAGINTMADLVDKTEDEMMKVRNLGRKSLEEVKKKMEDFGVSFKPGSTPIEE
ncbi:MAG: DNA-directed RNA polymerase subunit alpha [Selenomonadaceae bacterium]|nr:DNA-directed RNA polymerase subunit alpha [Selenomonadaceae bacterium]MBR1805696.1 DNA-directed RNA polymerase subunit alpha [Selenomonadaceae bacterium]